MVDITSEPAYEERDPLRVAWVELERIRTLLQVPLLRDGALVGVLAIYRREIRPFTDTQMRLLNTFADQAVIAIENVRLFNETKEALEQQTATGEILRVIASSPTDLQPVMQAVVENAARVCGAIDSSIFRLEGEHLRLMARHGPLRTSFAIGEPVPVRRDTVGGRADPRSADDPRRGHPGRRGGVSANCVPWQGALGSTIRTMAGDTSTARGHRSWASSSSIEGLKPNPFTDKQIELVATFADQAVIAIENVRLFKELEREPELTRSVGELRALGEVGQAISSTLDLETVLTTIVSRAAQLTGTDGGAIYEYDDAAEHFWLRAEHGLAGGLVAARREVGIRKGEGALGRLAVTREPIQITDIADEGAYQSHLRGVLLAAGVRSLLAVPLLREDRLIGGLVVNRNQPGEFAPEVVDLLRTFATQSALAIQNARLFHEIADKSRQARGGQPPQVRVPRQHVP